MVTSVCVAVVFVFINIFIIIIIKVRNKTPKPSSYLRPSSVKFSTKRSFSVLTTQGVVNCLVVLN